MFRSTSLSSQILRGEFILAQSRPRGDEKERVHGWTVEMELHNGNIHPLIWWYGQLMRLRDAPKLLTGKYYSKYADKRLRSSEWTPLKAHLEQELELLDKEYKRDRARSYRKKKRSQETMK